MRTKDGQFLRPQREDPQDWPSSSQVLRCCFLSQTTLKPRNVSNSNRTPTQCEVSNIRYSENKLREDYIQESQSTTDKHQDQRQLISLLAVKGSLTPQDNEERSEGWMGRQRKREGKEVAETAHTRHPSRPNHPPIPTTVIPCPISHSDHGPHIYSHAGS